MEKNGSIEDSESGGSDSVQDKIHGNCFPLCFLISIGKVELSGSDFKFWKGKEEIFPVVVVCGLSVGYCSSPMEIS